MVHDEAGLMCRTDQFNSKKTEKKLRSCLLLWPAAADQWGFGCDGAEKHTDVVPIAAFMRHRRSWDQMSSLKPE